MYYCSCRIMSSVKWEFHFFFPYPYNFNFFSCFHALARTSRTCWKGVMTASFHVLFLTSETKHSAFYHCDVYCKRSVATASPVQSIPFHSSRKQSKRVLLLLVPFFKSLVFVELTTCFSSPYTEIIIIFLLFSLIWWIALNNFWMITLDS